MAAHSAQTSDKAIGIGMLFVVIAALGALAMFVGAPDQLAGWGFAAAVVGGSLAVVATHVYAH